MTESQKVNAKISTLKHEVGMRKQSSSKNSTFQADIKRALLYKELQHDMQGVPKLPVHSYISAMFFSVASGRRLCAFHESERQHYLCGEADVSVAAPRSQLNCITGTQLVSVESSIIAFKSLL